MAARGVRGGDRRRTHVVLLISAALLGALSFAQPALAEDATGAPATDAPPTTATTTEPAPAADPATEETGSTEPAPTDPEPTQPASTSQESPPSDSDTTQGETTEPPPAEEPPAPVVTMEPEPVVTTECTGASGAEGAQTGACDTAATDATAEAPQAACDPNATDGGGTGNCPAESAEQADPPPSSATAPTVAATPTAQPAASTATVVFVVSLAPEQTAPATAQAAPVAGLVEPAKASVEEEPWAAIAPPPLVELAGGVASRVARLEEAESFLEGVVRLGVPEAVPLSRMTSLAYLPTVSEVMAVGTNVPGARASPPERDGHRAADAKAEEQEPPSADVVPGGPLDRQGLGSSGGSAGGVAGAASLRFFAIASTPLRFDYPSSFSHDPLPSSVPKGALEACPTTRPG